MRICECMLLDRSAELNHGKSECRQFRSPDLTQHWTTIHRIPYHTARWYDWVPRTYQGTGRWALSPGPWALLGIDQWVRINSKYCPDHPVAFGAEIQKPNLTLMNSFLQPPWAHPPHFRYFKRVSSHAVTYHLEADNFMIKSPSPSLARFESKSGPPFFYKQSINWYDSTQTSAEAIHTLFPDF